MRHNYTSRDCDLTYLSLVIGVGTVSCTFRSTEGNLSHMNSIQTRPVPALAIIKCVGNEHVHVCVQLHYIIISTQTRPVPALAIIKCGGNEHLYVCATTLLLLL